jgi:TRAP-type C4-dicarboxylate transport system substrate-binding protein
MKKRVLLVVLTIIFAAIAFLLNYGQEAPAAAPKVSKLRLTFGMPSTHHLSRVAELFKKEVEANTQGAVKVELYLGGELFKHSDLPRVLPVGGIETAICEGGHLGSLTPVVEAFGNSFMITSAAEFAKIRDIVVSIFDAELNKSNIKVLTSLDYGRGSLCGKQKFIKVPDDVKGLKIRGPTASYLRSIKQWGGIPVTLAAEEVYDALARNAIDGTLIGWSTYGSRGFYEVAKYYSGDANSTPWFLVMNLDTWKDLDSATQKIVMDAARKGEEASITLAKNDDEKWKKVILDKGGQIHVFTPEEIVKWKTATRPVYDMWVENCNKKGIGDKAITILKAIGIPGY